MSDDPLERKCKLQSLNEIITCKICHGYLVDATTVTECLHTFCKSCIVKHLEDSNMCFECEHVIHQSHPLDYIAYDRTLQDLVYKIVPSLEKDEYNRERKFYQDRGLPCPKDQALEEEKDDAAEAEAESKTPDTNTNMDFHRFDEQVSLLLELMEVEDSSKKTIVLKRRYIRCSSVATVTHLKKYIAKKLLNTIDRHKDVDISCNNELLFKDHTLKFVNVTRWRTKEPPMVLQYMPRAGSEVEG
jgi:polycomb group RING finger protein 3